MNTAISIPEIPKPPFRHYFRCRRGPLSWNQRLTGATTPFSAAFKSATVEVGLAPDAGSPGEPGTSREEQPSRVLVSAPNPESSSLSDLRARAPRWRSRAHAEPWRLGRRDLAGGRAGPLEPRRPVAPAAPQEGLEAQVADHRDLARGPPGPGGGADRR